MGLSRVQRGIQKADRESERRRDRRVLNNNLRFAVRGQVVSDLLKDNSDTEESAQSEYTDEPTQLGPESL